MTLEQLQKKRDSCVEIINKATRGATLRNFTEGQIIERTDALGKCYL